MPIIAHCDNEGCARQVAPPVLTYPTDDGGVATLILVPMGWVMVGLRAFCGRACHQAADAALA